MNEKVILALDFSDRLRVENVVSEFSGKIKWIKVGMELFYSVGPDIIYYLKDHDFSIFLDLKLHDIPNTVAHALKNLCKLPIDMINVHAHGGVEMMKQASSMVKDSVYSPYLIAVTQLTSTSEAEFNQMGYKASLHEHVGHLAHLAHESHLDGVVCSAHEVQIIKNHCGSDFLCVTPGIRFSDSNHDDQKRVMTPTQAINLGSDFLVMGRSLINSPDLLNKIPGVKL